MDDSYLRHFATLESFLHDEPNDSAPPSIPLSLLASSSQSHADVEVLPPREISSSSTCCNSYPVGIHFDMQSRYNPRTGVRLFVYNTPSSSPPRNIHFQIGFKHLGRCHLLASAADICTKLSCRREAFQTFFDCHCLGPEKPRLPCLDNVFYQAYKLRTHSMVCLRARAKSILKQYSINDRHLRSAPYVIKALCGGTSSKWVELPTAVRSEIEITLPQGIEGLNTSDFEKYAKDRKQCYNLSCRSVISGKSVIIHLVDFKLHGALVQQALDSLILTFEVPSPCITIEFKELEKGSATEIEDTLLDIADEVFGTEQSVLNIVVLPFVFIEEDEDIAVAIEELSQIGALVITVTDSKGEQYENVKSVQTEDALIGYCTTLLGQKSSFPKDTNNTNWVCSRNEDVSQVSTSLTCCFLAALASLEYLCEEKVNDTNIKAHLSRILSDEAQKPVGEVVDLPSSSVVRKDHNTKDIDQSSSIT
eukprot:TRINITY_DN2675_c0_g1_i1.p1 TRINITY_DN2675_c0_g1~~TRINITY_DN2675_c0_g1_i1.p1  ORF type:complete len:477 (-),score=51.44 TRINITY_DN2675_c0_g1_i1:158-1588(-)